MVHSHEFLTTKVSGINKVKVLMARMFQADGAEWGDQGETEY